MAPGRGLTGTPAGGIDRWAEEAMDPRAGMLFCRAEQKGGATGICDPSYRGAGPSPGTHTH